MESNAYQKRQRPCRKIGTLLNLSDIFAQISYERFRNTDTEIGTEIIGNKNKNELERIVRKSESEVEKI
jgi:hypothetical protein